MILPITLSDGTTTLTLPSDLEWRDEFAWTPVEHSTEYSLAGNLVVQEGSRQDGRPITLFGGREAAWIARSDLLQLYAIASVPGQQLTLSLWGTSYNVIFRRPPVEAEPIFRQADAGPNHRYAVTINLMEINP